MFAIIRRYDGVDQNRSAELTRKVNEMLVPKLEKLSGFAGYWLIESGNGVFSSPGPFETPEQGMESTKFVATWLRDEKPRHDRPQRAEDHERQGRRSQRPRPGRRVSSTAPHPDEKGPGLPGPFLSGSVVSGRCRASLGVRPCEARERHRRAGCRYSGNSRWIAWAIGLSGEELALTEPEPFAAEVLGDAERPDRGT